MKPNRKTRHPKGEAAIIALILIAAIFIVAVMWGWPKYRIYSQTLRGEAMLREAEWSKKVAIEEARATKESSTLKGEAEVARATGTAEANKIIGDSLKDNEAYLRYLWIQGLQDSSGERIYIPTEAGMPILEAGKAGK